MISPFKIIKAFGDTYIFNLPAYIIIYPIFYVSLLRNDSADPLSGQYQDPSPPIKIDGHDEYEVDDILAARLFGRAKRLQFKVKWKGYPPDGAQYNADGGEFDQSKAVVDDFYRRNPRALRSPRGRD